MAIRIVDVDSAEAFALIPPCADPTFDHRSCDYWEDADRGSKAARSSWLAGTRSSTPAAPPARSKQANPFLADLEAASPQSNPFAAARPANPFLTPGDEDEGPIANPFAPPPKARPTVGADAPRKLQLLG